MLGKLVLGMVLVIGGVVAYEHSKRIDEAQVRAYAEASLAATRGFDSGFVCDAMAHDFSLHMTEHVAAPGARITTLRDEGCENVRKEFAILRSLSERTGGLLVLDLAYEITRIEIAPGGRHALVEATSTVKLGPRLLVRMRSKERLSTRLWRVRSHGGEGHSWTYI